MCIYPSLRNLPIPGLRQAIDEFGQPCVRDVCLEVSQATFAYRERVRRQRPGEVVLVFRRQDGYLVHTKGHYPPGTYRLLSGGLGMGEDILAAVHREAFEETGLMVRIERFLGVIRYTFRWDEQRSTFTSFVFLLSEDRASAGGRRAPRSLDPTENIVDIKPVPLSALPGIARHLEALPSTVGEEANRADWGRFRAIAHRFVVEALQDG